MQTSNVSDLKTRLKEKMEQDRHQTESLMSEQLQQLTKSLKASASAEATSTKKSMALGFKNLRKEIKTEIQETEAAADLSEIRTQIEKLNRDLGRAWIRPAVIGLALVIALGLGTWGLSAAMTASITSKLRTWTEIKKEIESQRQTLAEIRTGTWGVDLMTHGAERYIILPPGAETGYKLAGRPAVKIK